MDKITKLESIYYSIYRGLYNLKWAIIMLPFKLKRAFMYAYKSWGIHDFDYCAILEMMHYSLSRLEPCIKNGYSVNGKKHAKDIRILMEYIYRIKDHSDCYHYKYQDLVKEFPDQPDLFESHNVRVAWHKENPDYYKKFKIYSKHIAELENRDVEEFSRRLKKIRTYWD
jgi:hypothetical protein